MWNRCGAGRGAFYQLPDRRIPQLAATISTSAAASPGPLRTCGDAPGTTPPALTGHWPDLDKHRRPPHRLVDVDQRNMRVISLTTVHRIGRKLRSSVCHEQAVVTRSAHRSRGESMTTPVPAQAVVRPNAYAKGGTFDNPDLLWYAKGIAALQQRPLADPTSWRFWAAIHGVDQQTWTDLGFWGADEAPPSHGVQAKLWAQCQHGSWYFLP